MNKILSTLFLILSVLMSANLWAQEPYIVLDSGDKLTMTYYYDTNKSSHTNGYVVDFENRMSDNVYTNNRDYVEEIYIDSTFVNYPLTTANALFSNFTALTAIYGLGNLNTSNVEDMYAMFAVCTKLTSLDVSGLNTANVKYMGSMFEECTSLTTLDLSNFNTANVTKMSYMFYHCSSLTTIYVSSLWSTANVTSTNGATLFTGCNNLVGGAGTTYDEEHQNVDYAHIDGGPDNPGYLTSSGETPNVVAPEAYAVLSGDNTTLTFYYDDQKVARNGMDIGPFAYLEHGFGESQRPWHDVRESITDVVFDSSMANDTTLISTGWWFYGCTNLKRTSGWQYLPTANIVDMWGMFENCSSLSSNPVEGGPDFSAFNTASLKRTCYLFHGCTSMTSIDLSTFNTANVTETEGMFKDCAALTTIYVGSGWTMTNVSGNWEDDMFSGSTSLVGGAGTTYDASNIGVSYAHIDGGPDNPGYLTSNGDTPYVVASEAYAVLSDDDVVLSQSATNITYGKKLTFYYDNQKSARNGMSVDFTDRTLREWESSSSMITSVVFDSSFANDTTLTSTAWWFYNLGNLTTVTGIENLNTNHVTNMYSMFSDCSKLTSLDVTGFNTSNVTDMGYMFVGCSGLTTLDVRGFNTSNVTNMRNMFDSCSGLTSLDVSNFNTANVTNMYGMFMNCSGLTTLDLSSFNTAKVEVMDNMFCQNAALATISVDGTKWSTAAVASSTSMFYMCPNLVGGKGTTYDANHVDASYAHIDGGPDNPGYLTDINAPLDTVATPTFSLSGDDLVISTTTEGATINYTISDRQNYYLVGGNGEWGSDKSQKFTLTGYVGGVPAIYSYVLTGTGSDLWFAFGDAEALDAIDNGYWSLLYGTKGNSEDLYGSFDRRTNLGFDGSFHVDGTSPYYKFTINMVDMTYEITPLDSHPGIVPAGDSLSVLTYTQPIPLDRDMVIKATATKAGMNDSETATLDYPFSTWQQMISMRSTSQTAVNTYANRTEVAELVEQLKALMIQADNMYTSQRLTATVDEILNLYNQMLDVYVSIENTLRNRSTELAASDKYYVVGEVNRWMPENAIQNMFYRDANGNFTYTTDWGTTQWALKVWDTRGIVDWTSAWGTTVDGCQDESGVLTSINTVSNGAFAPPAWSDSTGVNYCTLTFNAKTHEYMWTHLDDQQPTEYQTVGIVGDFNGWGNDVEMTQVAPHNWYIRYTFPQRTSFKLRANNAWDANWGYGVQTTRSYYCINGINGANIGVEADEYDIYLNDITGQINMVPTREFSVLTAEDVEITMYKSADVATQCSLRGGLGYYSMSNAQYNNAGDMLVNTPNAPAVLPDTEGHVTVPAEANGYSVVAIPAYAFNGTKISGITLPAGIVDYQDNAFAGCASLDTVTSLRQSPVAIPDSTFSMAHYEHAVLFVPEGAIDAYKATDGWKNFSNIYEIGTVIPDPEAYAVLSGDSITLTFYYDKKREERGGRVFQSGTEVYWPNYVTGVTKVSFDESFADFSPTSTSSWFAGFNSLTSIEGMEYLNTEHVTSMISMFQYCENLTSLDLSRLQTGHVETMTNMFYGCKRLANLNLSGFSTANVTSLASMFYGCQSLTMIDLSSFNTSNVTRMEEMFQDCAGLTTLDLTNFNTENVENMTLMFAGCTNLATIYAGSGWSVAKAADSRQMFYDCTSLVGGQGTVYDAEYTDKTYAHIDGGTSNPGYFTLPLSMGDANGDGNINIADAVATVTNILGQPTEAAFYMYAADMNTDQVIDIFDVTLIVNAAFDAASPAPAMTRGSASNIMMEHISMTADADYIYLGIDQPERFTATQFDVTLPEGMELVDARLASATTDHQLSFVKRGNNEYRVIGLSMSNTTFRSMNGQLIKLEVSGSAVDSDVKMSNVLFVTLTATVMTSIDKCLNTAKAADDSLYDLKGQRLSKQQLGKGIYIMNHKKVIIK